MYTFTCKLTCSPKCVPKHTRLIWWQVWYEIRKGPLQLLWFFHGGRRWRPVLMSSVTGNRHSREAAAAVCVCVCVNRLKHSLVLLTRANTAAHSLKKEQGSFNFNIQQLKPTEFNHCYSFNSEGQVRQLAGPLGNPSIAYAYRPGHIKKLVFHTLGKTTCWMAEGSQ